MGLVLWLIVRRSSAQDDDTPAPGPRTRGSLSSLSGAAGAASPSSLRSGAGPESLSAQLNWLVGIAGDVQGKTFHVGNRTGTIGRGLGNFIQTTDPDASRVHCQFMPVPGGLQLKDMESSNGTFVNNQRITVALLKENDQVRIGKAVMVYRARGDFGHDFGLERKVVGATAAKQTQLGTQSDLKTMLRQALADAGGDVPRAAATMGVKPEHFLAMLAQYGVDAGQKKS